MFHCEHDRTLGKARLQRQHSLWTRAPRGYPRLSTRPGSTGEGVLLIEGGRRRVCSPAPYPEGLVLAHEQQQHLARKQWQWQIGDGNATRARRAACSLTTWRGATAQTSASTRGVRNYNTAHVFEPLQSNDSTRGREGLVPGCNRGVPSLGRRPRSEDSCNGASGGRGERGGQNPGAAPLR